MGTLRLHYEEKNILRPIGAFFLLKLKVTKIPILPFSLWVEVEVKEREDEE